MRSPCLSSPDMPRSALHKLSPEGRAEYWATLALRATKGLGVRSICRLLRHFGSAYSAVHSVPHWADAGITPEKGRELSAEAWRIAARPEWEKAHDLEGEILLWSDARYPELLRELPDAPALLYIRGDASLLENPCFAVVGARRSTDEGRTVSANIANELASCGVTVISGLARGIDAAAHQAALPLVGSTIAVLGCGLDTIYPPQHEALHTAIGKKGLLISEFAPGTLPDAANFPIRNRIISGMSLGILVVEAALRSGSLVTARLALEQNRAVFAVPGPTSAPSSAGCRELARQGAKVVFNAADILVDLLPQLLPFLPQEQEAPTKQHVQTIPPEAACQASQACQSSQASQPSQSSQSSQSALPAQSLPGQSQVLQCLLAHGPQHPDSLLALINNDLPLAAEWDSASLSAALILLEVGGSVKRLPGTIYRAAQTD